MELSTYHWSALGKTAPLFESLKLFWMHQVPIKKYVRLEFKLSWTHHRRGRDK